MYDKNLFLEQNPLGPNMREPLLYGVQYLSVPVPEPIAWFCWKLQLYNSNGKFILVHTEYWLLTLHISRFLGISMSLHTFMMNGFSIDLVLLSWVCLQITFFVNIQLFNTVLPRRTLNKLDFILVGCLILGSKLPTICDLQIYCTGLRNVKGGRR